MAFKLAMTTNNQPILTHQPF